jgi:beta-glucosidase-like glycosyl hydrolase
MLGPGVNIYRQPVNGRNFEYFGEDPFLSSSMAVGYVTGMQSQWVSATIKHFLGNSSGFLRYDSDSVITEKQSLARRASTSSQAPSRQGDPSVRRGLYGVNL